MISLAVGLDSELAIEEFKSRINTDLEAFQILDGFIKNSLQAMVEKGEDKKEIELVRVPLKGSTRDRKDRGVVERVDTENVWLRLSDQNAVMPFRINELKDAFISSKSLKNLGSLHRNTEYLWGFWLSIGAISMSPRNTSEFSNQKEQILRHGKRYWNGHVEIPEHLGLGRSLTQL